MSHSMTSTTCPKTRRLPDMKTSILIILILAGAIVLSLVLAPRLFRFTDHDDNMDDEGGWK